MERRQRLFSGSHKALPPPPPQVSLRPAHRLPLRLLRRDDVLGDKKSAVALLHGGHVAAQDLGAGGVRQP